MGPPGGRSIRSRFAGSWMRLGLLATLVVIFTAGTSAVRYTRVSSAGLCFAAPSGRIDLWAYSPGTDLNLTYRVETHASGRTNSEFTAAVSRSFSAWSKGWQVLRFHQVPRGPAQIVVEFGRFGKRGFWHSHAGLTTPQIDLLGCGMSQTVIQLNDSYLIRNGRVQYPLSMLRHLVAHEIGHALGLKHVYRSVPSVMTPTSAAYRYARPQPYDIRSVARLYPMASPTVPEGLAAGGVHRGLMGDGRRRHAFGRGSGR